MFFLLLFKKIKSLVATFGPWGASVHACLHMIVAAHHPPSRFITVCRALPGNLQALTSLFVHLEGNSWAFPNIPPCFY